MAGYERGVFSKLLREEMRKADEDFGRLLRNYPRPDIYVYDLYPDAIEAEFTEQSKAPRPLPLPAEAGVGDEVEGEVEGDTGGRFGAR